MKSRNLASSRSADRGFTLLEVMAALAIFAVAAIALVRIGMNYTQSIVRMQDRTFAHFVAMNELAQLEISGSWPEGTAENTVDMHGQQWQVSYEAFNTISQDIKRIEIDVAPVVPNQKKAAAPVTHLTAFLQRPVAQSGN